MNPLIATLVFENVARPWLWAILIVAGAVILVATYRGIVRRSERRLGWWLMALRGVGLLALVAALAKPTWTRESEQVDPARVAVVLDDSSSMGLADASGASRYAVARDGIDKLRSALAANPKAARVAADLFDIQGNPIDAQPPERPTAGRTDLARAVRSATARMRSRPLGAVVLVSDGMDNTGRREFRDLADSPVPVHTLGFPADAAAAGLDLAVRNVVAPERATVHNAIKVDVRVSKTSGPPTRATVTLRRGKETFASQEVSLPAGNAETAVGLTMTPSQPGQFVFTAAVAAAAGERRQDNNVRSFPLRVDSEPIRVLYLEGFLRYEYKYLKARLEDDADVSLVTVVRRVSPERGETKAPADLVTAERLKSFDVVILGDMEGGYLAAPEYQAIVRWLDGKGHALLVLGGYRSFGPDGFRATPLADVLPVTFAAPGEPSQSEEPFALQLTEAGRRHPIFALSGDRVRDAASWAAAPPLLGSSLVRGAKPGADVLAVNPNVTVGGKPAVVAAAQRYGAGHVMALAIDTTWRWSRLTRVLGQSDTLFARFWSQTLRWLAGRTLDDERPLLLVATDRADGAVGKPVTIRATRQPRPSLDLARSELAAEVVGPTGRPVAVPLRSSSAEPDVFTGTFVPPAGGRYEVASTLSAAGKPLANAAAEFLVQGPDLELADPGTNPANLRAIASATGGVALDVADAASLADKIELKERRTVRTEQFDLWDSPFLFATFLAAVGGEWVLRRRNHLV